VPRTASAAIIIAHSRKGHRKGRAAPFGTVHRDGSSMALDNLGHNGESHTQAGDRLLIGTRGPIEAVKNLVALLARDAQATIAYITKFGHEPTSKTPWGVEAEMTKAHIKQARTEAGMTPFALLGAIADGLEKYAPRWQEYASVFKGRKQLTYSPGLKARYQEEEKTDEELADEGETTEALTLVDLSPEQWNVVVERRARGGLLELIRTGRIGEIIEGLAEIGVQVQPPEMRGWQVSTPGGQGKALTVCLSQELRCWRCSVMLDQVGPDGYHYQIYDLSDITVVSAGVPVQACA
jgi:hypothetical protein